MDIIMKALDKDMKNAREHFSNVRTGKIKVNKVKEIKLTKVEDLY